MDRVMTRAKRRDVMPAQAGIQVCVQDLPIGRLAFPGKTTGWVTPAGGKSIPLGPLSIALRSSHMSHSSHNLPKIVHSTNPEPPRTP